MILKIVDQENITIGGVQVYENNADGKLTVQDTYHIVAIIDGLDDIFGTNEEQILVKIDVSQFKENCLIAGEVYHEFADSNDEDFYKMCIESICDRLEVGVGPIPDRVYEIWSIIEEEYL